MKSNQKEFIMKRPIKYLATTALLCSLSFATVHVTQVNPSNSASSTSTPAVNDPFAQMDQVFAAQMRQMEQMRRQMDAMFSNFEQNFQAPTFRQTPRLIHSSGVFSSGFQDKGDHYELKIRVADLKNSKIDITSENGMITITAQAQKKQERTKGNYGKVISFASSSSTQSFTLPPDADETTIKAEQQDNTITITLKKKKGAVQKSKVIPIVKKDGNTSKKK
jgi:HSP20 family molecular chaperone IbpA